MTYDPASSHQDRRCLDSRPPGRVAGPSRPSQCCAIISWRSSMIQGTCPRWRATHAFTSSQTQWPARWRSPRFCPRPSRASRSRRDALSRTARRSAFTSHTTLTRGRTGSKTPTSPPRPDPGASSYRRHYAGRSARASPASSLTNSACASVRLAVLPLFRPSAELVHGRIGGGGLGGGGAEGVSEAEATEAIGKGYAIVVKDEGLWVDFASIPFEIDPSRDNLAMPRQRLAYRQAASSSRGCGSVTQTRVARLLLRIENGE